MERMKKKKKEIRLRTFFVRFLLKLVAAVLLAFLLWLLQITVSVGTGLILPANAAEKEAAQIILEVLSSILATQMPCRSCRSGA